MITVAVVYTARKMGLVHGRPREDSMHYHRWCNERIQEAEQEIKTGERTEDLL